MTDSAEATFVPVIGYENIPLITDAAPSDPNDAIVPLYQDDSGDYVRVNTLGNGDASSLVTPGGVGRLGSLKTVLQTIFTQDSATEPYTFTLYVKIPPNIRGLVPPGYTLAQINDVANAPLFDPSLAVPLVYAKPSFSFASGDGNGPANTFPMQEASGVGWEVTMQAGATVYIPPQTYANFFTGLLVNPEDSPYGIFAITVFLLYEANSTPLANQAFDVIVDFSHTVVN